MRRHVSTGPGLALVRTCDVEGCRGRVARVFRAGDETLGRRCRRHAAEVLRMLRLAARMVRLGTPAAVAVDWAAGAVWRGRGA